MSIKSWEAKLKIALNGYIEAVGRDVVGSRWSGPDFNLLLPVHVSPSNDGNHLNIDLSILDTVRSAFKEANLRTAGFRNGHVYCYFCQTNSCAHSKPVDYLSVFSGYQANGIPNWRDLQELLLDSGDERVEKIYGPEHTLLAVSQRGRDLKHKMLSDFGKASKTYDILGQVVFGCLSVRLQSVQERAISLAVSLQAVESRGADRLFQLDMNIVSALPDSIRVLDLILEQGHERLFEAIVKARRKIKELEELIRNGIRHGNMKARPEFLREVPGIMLTLTRTIEQFSRQSGRRTRHANERMQENRPIPAATDDLRAANESDHYMDLRKSSMIIRGPHQRIHVFSLDGNHITSLKLKPDDVLRRIRLERWRKATPDEVNRFRSHVRKRSGETEANHGTVSNV